MVQYIPAPDPRSIIPPLLACLPTAFVSPRPPPALIPLLSPILQQRVQLHATSSASSSSESWLPLLCWDQQLATRLVDIVSESDAFEIHPTSGEIETGNIEPSKYRRLDEDTLQARLILTDVRLDVVLLCCVADAQSGNQWRIAEVRPIDESLGRNEEWYPSISQAEEEANQKVFLEATKDRDQDKPVSDTDEHIAADEDDYWAQYDKTPGRTPAPGRSPAPDTSPQQSGHARTTSELEYFERYASVQPALDSEDPSQEPDGMSIPNDNTLSTSAGFPSSSMGRKDSANVMPDPSFPQPLTAPSSHNVSRLENIAADVQPDAKVAAKEHITATVKSLVQLSRTIGIERTEFEHLVMTETRMFDQQQR